MADVSTKLSDWRLERPVGSPLRRTENDRVTMPLRILQGEEEVAEALVVWTMAEAEFLHAQLCRALDGQPVPGSAPECRQAVEGDAWRRRTGW